jgi:hypothetical protein
MRVTCAKCQERFDVSNRAVLAEADRLKIAAHVDGNRAPTRPINLILDELDYDTIQYYIADYQAASKNIAPGKPTIVPDGESNLVGAIMAECVRNLLEYRSLFDGDK